MVARVEARLALILHQMMWGGPPGPRGSPRTRFPRSSRKIKCLRRSEPARGPAADQGVRPTSHAGAWVMGNEVAVLPHYCLPLFF